MISKNTSNLIDIYQETISKYKTSIAFQLKNKSVTYMEFDRNVAKIINYLNETTKKYIQIATNNGYYFATTYFAVIITNNIAVLSNENLEKTDIKIDIKFEDITVEKILANQISKEIQYGKKYDSEEVSTIIFSSGTTNEKKGIKLSMKNILTTVNECVDRLSYFNTDRCVNVIPLTHIFGFMGDFLSTFYTGACMCILDTKYELYDSLIKYKPNYLNLPPILVENLLVEIKKRGKNFTGNNIRRIMCAGASISNNIIQEYKEYDIKILPCYGLTEAPCIALCSDKDKDNNGVGKVLKCNEVYICENGQILVCGDNVMLGYTKENNSPFTIINDKRYLKTNDVGKFDCNGNLMIMGRIDNIVSLKNGTKVQIELIEERIKKINKVKEVKVEVKDNNLVAIIATDERNKAEIENKVKKLNFGGNCISKICYVNSIKRNLLGKVIRNGK